MGWHVRSPSQPGPGAPPPGKAPTITTTSPLPAAVGGQAYSYTLAATGGTTPYTWAATGLPSWLTLNTATGELTGVAPSTGSTSSFSVTVTGAGLTSAATSLSLTVQSASASKLITSRFLPAAYVGVAYNWYLDAYGGTTPYTWTLTGGTLPAGLSLTSAGVIQGTPTSGAVSPSTGPVSLTFTCKDSTGATIGTKTLPLRVWPAVTGLNIVQRVLPIAYVGQSYSFPLSPINGTPPYVVSFLGGTMPASGWLTYSQSVGILSGTPGAGDVAGNELQVYVTDNAGTRYPTSGGIFISLPVDTPGPPQVITTALAKGVVGFTYLCEVTATGCIEQGNPVWTASNLPPGLSIDSEYGVIYGTPTSAGSYTPTVQVIAPQPSAAVQIPITIAAAGAANIDVWLAPTGDDTTGAGTQASPWSFSALINNASQCAGKRCGCLPGTYQGGYNNGVFTPWATYIANATSSGAGGSPAIPVPYGTAANPTQIVSVDANGNYSPRTAILSCKVGSGKTITGSVALPTAVTGGITGCILTVTSTTATITAPEYLVTPDGTPCWIFTQLTGTFGGAGTYMVGPQQDMQYPAGSTFTSYDLPLREKPLIGTFTQSTTPVQGYYNIQGLTIENATSTAVLRWYVRYANLFDCDLRYVWCGNSIYNAATVHLKFADNCHTWNNKIHDNVASSPLNVLLASAPASGSTLTTLTLAQPWPYEPNGTRTAALSTGQQITVSITTGSATLTVSGSPVVTGTPTTWLTVRVGGPGSSWHPFYPPPYMQIPAGMRFMTTYKNNTSWGCPSLNGPQKDNLVQCLQSKYNYFESLGWLGKTFQTVVVNGLSQAVIGNHYDINGCGPYQTQSVHHNIVVSAIGIENVTFATSVMHQGVVQVYNNTISGANVSLTAIIPGLPDGTFIVYNNLMTPSTPLPSNNTLLSLWYNFIGTNNSVDYINGTYSYGGPGTTYDHNGYPNDPALRFGFTRYGTAPPTPLTFAQWQTPGAASGAPTADFPGYDVTSIQINGSPYSGTPTHLQPNSYALAAGGPWTTAGRNNAPLGALDGSGPVGCNF